MGVHMLLYWSPADGAARREAFDALSDAIQCLGSSASSRWTAQAAAFRRAQERSADDLPSARAASSEVSLHRVLIGDEQGQVFLLSRSAKQVLQAGSDMMAFLDHMALFKTHGGVQLEGMQHAVGDFRICLARAVQIPQQNFLGLAVDVGYLPLHDAATAAPMLQDMAEVLQEAAQAAGGRLQQVKDSTAGFQLPAAYGARHRAVQYMQLLAQLQEQQAG